MINLSVFNHFIIEIIVGIQLVGFIEVILVWNPALLIEYSFKCSFNKLLNLLLFPFHYFSQGVALYCEGFISGKTAPCKIVPLNIVNIIPRVVEIETEFNVVINSIGRLTFLSSEINLSKSDNLYILPERILTLSEL